MGSFGGSLGSIWVEIGAKIAGFESGMAQISKGLDSAMGEAEKKFAGFSKLGSTLTSVGTGLTAALTAPLVGVGIAATKFASDFELSMRQVTSLMGKEGSAAFQGMSDQVLELSKRLGVDATGAAKALYEAISAGVPKDNAIEFLGVASKAAIAGVTETKVAVDGITTVLNSYRLGAEKAGEVSDAMFQSVNIGKFTFDQLAASLSTAIPQADKIGIGFKEILASAATLSSKGVPVAQAMTQIAAAMRSVTAPGDEMRALFKEIGVESGIALIQSRGFQGALEAINTAAEGNVDVLQKAAGRIEGYEAIVGLTGDSAAQAALDIDKITNSAGATDLAFTEINKSFTRQMQMFMAQVKGIGIEIGKALLPTLTLMLDAMKPVVAFVGDLVKWFGTLPDPVKAAGIALLALAAAAGPILIILGQLATAVGAIGGLFASGGLLAGLGITASGFLSFALVIPIVIAALAALGVWVSKNWDPIVAVVKQAWDGISEIWGAAWEGIVAIFEPILRPIVAIFEGIWDGVITSFEFVKDTVVENLGIIAIAFAPILIPAGLAALAIIGVTTALIKLGDWVFGNWPAITKFVGEAWDSISSTWSTVWDAAITHLEQQWAGVAQLAELTWGGIQTFFSALWEPVSGYFSAAWTAIGGVLKQVWSGVAAFANSIWTPIARFFSTLWEGIAGYFQSSWTAVSNFLVGVWNGIRNVAIAVWKSITDSINSFLAVAAKIPGVSKLLNLDEAWKSANKTSEALKATNVAAMGMGAALAKTGQNSAPAAAALGKVTKSSDALKASVEGAEAAYKNTARAFNTGKASAEDLEKAQIKLTAAQDKLDPTRVLDRFGKAWEDAAKRYEENAKWFVESDKKLAELDKDLEHSKQQLATTFAKAHEDMRRETLKQLEVQETFTKELPVHYGDAIGQITVTMQRLPVEVQKAIQSTKELDEAFKALGITSSTELQKQADVARSAYAKIAASGKASAADRQQAEEALSKATAALNRGVEDSFKTLGVTSTSQLQKQAEAAKAAYEQIAGDSEASDRDRQASWAKAERARIEASRAAGEEIPRSQERALEKIESGLEKSTGKQKSIWQDMSNQVSTIFSDVGKSIFGRITELFSGESEAKLKEQENQLRGSLAEREQDWVDYQAEIASKLAGFNAEYEEQLRSEEATFIKSLEERKRDFEDYQKDIADQLDDLRQEHREAASKERDSLLDGLDDRTRDYEDYRSDIGRNIDDLRKKHATSAKEETAKLGTELGSRTKEYKRYVEDVNLDLARIREKNKGQSSEEEQDLLISLQRRTQDYHDYVADNAEAVQAVASKHKEAVAAEEEEQRLALDRRTRDYQLYVEEINEKVAASTAAHKKELEQEEEDLRESLEKKTQEYEAYKSEAAERFEGVRAAAKAKLTEQEIDLQSSLQKQLAEWQKYQTDVASQLTAIEDQHRSVFDKIRDLGVGVFTDIGTAIGRMVTEQLTGSLFKSLFSLVDDILPKVGAAFGKVFGGGAASTAADVGGSIFNAPTIPGGGSLPTTGGVPPGSGAASQAVSAGLSGVVSAVANVASAVTGVIGVFQSAKQEGTLNQIERNTAAGSIHLQHTLENSNKYWPGITMLSDWTVNHWSPAMQSLMSTTEESRDWLRNSFLKYESLDSRAGQSVMLLQIIADAIPYTTMQMQAISDNTRMGSEAERNTTSTLSQLLSMAASRPIQATVNVNGVTQPSSAVEMKINGLIL